MIKVGSILIVLLLILCSCSDQNIVFGKWTSKAETHEFVKLTPMDAQALGELPQLIFKNNDSGWIKVKTAGKSPEAIKPTLKPYSVAVIESGFVFMQSTRRTTKFSTYDDIEWGWKIILENRSKRGVHAYGGYTLFDKDGFILTTTGKDLDNLEFGVFIKSGERGTIRGRGLWKVKVASKPYPTSRIFSGDYKLFLRHDRFEFLD